MAWWERLTVSVMPDVDGFAIPVSELGACPVDDNARKLLEIAKEFLWEDERIVLDMLADGKGPTDVAEVFGYSSRQAATYLIARVMQAAIFYCRNIETIINLVRLGRLGTEQLEDNHIRLIHALVVDRRTYQDVGQFYERSHSWVSGEVAKARQAAEQAGLVDVVKMLDDFDGCKSIRNRRRRMPDGAKWRDKFRDTMLMLADKGVWYVWGGQKPFGFQSDVGAQGVADCSGLVLEVLKKLGKLPKGFPDMTAQSLSREFATTSKPQPGDLVFYGKDWRRVTHVMFYFGELEYRDDKKITEAVVGMCGGRRDMDVTEAKLFGGMLKFQRGPAYRRDLLGFRKIT